MEPAKHFGYTPPAGIFSGVPPYPAGNSRPYGGVPAPADPTRPLVVLGGKKPTEEESEQIKAVFGRQGMAMNAIVLLLMGAMLLYVFLGYFKWEFWMENLLMLVASLLFFGIGFGLLVWRRKRLLRNTVDAQIGEDEDRTVEIYADRLVSISAAQRLILPFSRIRRAMETPAFFLFIGVDGRFIVLRSADLTPFDARKVRETVFPCLSEPQRENKGWILPALARPLPIAVYSWETPEEFVSTERAGTRYREKLKAVGWLLPLWYAFALAAGVRMANAFWITPNYILDSVLFSLMVTALILVLYAIIGAVALQVTKNRQLESGERPLYIGVSKRSFLLGDRWQTVRVLKDRLLVIKKGRGWEFRRCQKKGSRWLAAVSKEDLTDPSVMEAFLPEKPGRPDEENK